VDTAAARVQSGSLGETLKVVRLTHSDRRDALLDAAVGLVTSGALEDLTMEAVAERAGVSRPLVYKHFSNRHDLLSAVYQREAAVLHRELAIEVGAAPSTEEMFRTLVRGSLRAARERGHLFAALRSAGAWNRVIRAEERDRDRNTVAAFAARSMREYDLDRRNANWAAAVLLGAIDSALAQWRLKPSEKNALLVEDIYMAMVRGVYGSLKAAGS
jgi:AcrR family transcriptional regulator